MLYFRSILDDTNDEDTDELNLFEDLSNDFKSTISDSNSTYTYGFPEQFKNAEQYDLIYNI